MSVKISWPLALLLCASSAFAEEPAPDAGEPAQEPAQEEPEAEKPAPPPAPPPPPREPTEEELLSQASTYIITDTRESGPGRPGRRFDPDTELRLTAEELRERGVQNLGDALLLVPEVLQRPSGRGEVRVDIRGARKGDVLIIIDGVAINEPYYGIFDVSSIPITDIAEIRVSLSPASPLDGPGGGGGVIEVVTTAASGPRRLQAHVEGSTAPGALASVTGRTPVTERLSVRLSGGGSFSARDFDRLVPDGSHRTLAEGSRAGQAAFRSEYKLARGELLADGWFAYRTFLALPSQDETLQVQRIDLEMVANGALGGSFGVGNWRLEGRGYVQKLNRDLTNYSDSSQAIVASREQIRGDREGLLLRANRFLGRWGELALALNADTEQATDADELGNVSGGRSTIAEVAAGLLWKGIEGIRVESSAGMFVPLDNPSAAWPEGKVMISLLPKSWLEVRVTGARKGRAPSLRERYQIGVGNPNLRSEISSFGQLELAFRPRPWFIARTAGYVRLTDDFIRFNDARTQQTNYGDLTVAGIETSVEVGRGRAIGGGGSYQLGKQSTSGTQMGIALANFPEHKGDVWVEARLNGRAGLFSRLRYVSAQTDQGTLLAAYAELDISLWAKLYRDFRGAVRAQNVTDARHLIRAGQYSLGRTIIVSLDAVWE